MPAKIYYEEELPKEEITGQEIYLNIARPILEKHLTVNELGTLDHFFKQILELCECDICDHCGQLIE